MKLNYLIFTVIFLFVTNKFRAQDLNRIFFEIDAVTKASVGKEKRDLIYYEPNHTIDVPKISTYDYYINGLNFSFTYKLNKHFSAGLGSGLNFTLEERPGLRNEYHYKIMLPFFARFRYHTNFYNNFLFLTDLNAGYQSNHFKHGNTEDGFLFKEKGGLLLNFDLGLGMQIAKFTPILKVGYEINQLNNEYSLGMLPQYTYEDKVKFTTYYHLLKVSFSLKL